MFAITSTSSRSRSAMVISLAAVAALMLAGCGNDADESTAEGTAEAGRSLEGVVEYDDLARNHVEGTVDYPQNPPVGGDHAPVWMNCGAYAEPVAPEMAVHSLEHGAVWIAHDPELDATQVAQLGEVAAGNGFVLVSPVDGMESPVVATAWGVQLPLESADDPQLSDFVTAYAQGPQTPEPGAPCTGGMG